MISVNMNYFQLLTFFFKRHICMIQYVETSPAFRGSFTSLYSCIRTALCRIQSWDPYCPVLSAILQRRILRKIEIQDITAGKEPGRHHRKFSSPNRSAISRENANIHCNNLKRKYNFSILMFIIFYRYSDCFCVVYCVGL